MRALIRFLTRTAGGTVETRDRIVDGDAITLGRATDRTLHLKDSRVALEHARIFRSGGRTLIACRAPAQVIVNGGVRRDADLHVGDVVQIGANALKFIEPPAGFDLALTFELDSTADTRAATVDAPRLALHELGMRKRPWAWAFFLLCLAGGLVIPLSGALHAGGSQELRRLHLPSDRLWLPGPLHLAHETLNGRCEACHEQVFAPVRSGACLNCHSTNLHRHVNRSSVERGVDTLVTGTACTSCHSEHEQPPRLIQEDQRLCANCHDGRRLSAAGDERIARATDFLLDHPDFGPGIAQFDRRVRDQGLKFSHDVHLDPKGVKAPDGKVVMKCVDCHRPDAAGRRMQPIRMERDCAGCHRLDFDPAEPDRAVPHGEPQRVMATLVEYYSARYLAGYPDRLGTAKPDRIIQLPSISISRTERERLMGLARTRAELVARDLFERRVCNECHTVARDASSASPVWTVAKVQLMSEWLPAARFDHSKHNTSLTPCSTCHAAEHSKSASDVLMPRIKVCRECHSGEQGGSSDRSLVASTCTMCHAFHLGRNPLWADRHQSGSEGSL